MSRVAERRLRVRLPPSSFGGGPVDVGGAGRYQRPPPSSWRGALLLCASAGQVSRFELTVSGNRTNAERGSPRRSKAGRTHEPPGGRRGVTGLTPITAGSYWPGRHDRGMPSGTFGNVRNPKAVPSARHDNPNVQPIADERPAMSVERPARSDGRGREAPAATYCLDRGRPPVPLNLGATAFQESYSDNAKRPAHIPRERGRLVKTMRFAVIGLPPRRRRPGVASRQLWSTVAGPASSSPW